jgi:5-hydroxyisourate hydrolase
MSPITTHVLDTRLGAPAAGVSIHLEKRDAAGGWHLLASGVANEDGRLADLLADGGLTKGHHRLSFDVGAYFEQQEVEHFYPQVAIEFNVADPAAHYHVPLLLSPFGYSTYRGS